MGNKSRVIAAYGIKQEGKGKALVFEADLTNKHESDFASDLEAVAATKPNSLQEFITRLVEVQKISEPSVTQNN